MGQLLVSEGVFGQLLVKAVDSQLLVNQPVDGQLIDIEAVHENYLGMEPSFFGKQMH